MYVLAFDFDGLLHSANIIPIIAIVTGCGVGVIAIICGTVSHVARSRAAETTKREIAAYVAEGSIDPDKAIAMLKAGSSSDENMDA